MVFLFSFFDLETQSSNLLNYLLFFVYSSENLGFQFHETIFILSEFYRARCFLLKVIKRFKWFCSANIQRHSCITNLYSIFNIEKRYYWPFFTILTYGCSYTDPWSDMVLNLILKIDETIIIHVYFVFKSTHILLCST